MERVVYPALFSSPDLMNILFRLALGHSSLLDCITAQNIHNKLWHDTFYTLFWKLPSKKYINRNEESILRPKFWAKTTTYEMLCFIFAELWNWTMDYGEGREFEASELRM